MKQEGNCFGLNNYVLSRYMLKCNQPECNSMRKWAFGKDQTVSVDPQEGDSCPLRWLTELPCPFCHIKTRQQTYEFLDLEQFSVSRTVSSEFSVLEATQSVLFCSSSMNAPRGHHTSHVQVSISRLSQGVKTYNSLSKQDHISCGACLYPGIQRLKAMQMLGSEQQKCPLSLITFVISPFPFSCAPLH